MANESHGALLHVPTGPSRNDLRKMSDFLIDNDRIRFETESYLKHRRYVKLKLTEIFNSLVELYSAQFKTQWNAFRRATELQAGPPQGVEPQTFMARIYISHWLMDLYVSNKDAVFRLSPIAYSQKFRQKMSHHSNEYDTFLAYINQSIRPTNVKGVLEDTLYIPDFPDGFNISAVNPFAIPGFTQDKAYLRAILNVIKDKRTGWSTTTLSNDTVGSPTWLFDWHEDNQVCSWFPFEGNFQMEDVTLAYIIGVACTPKLATRDVDDWQMFPNNVIPREVIPALYNRLIPQRFFGAYEVTTISSETEVLYPPGQAPESVRESAAKRPRSSDSGSEPTRTTQQEQPMDIGLEYNKFRITTWIYHYRVVLDQSDLSREFAWRGIVQNPDATAN